jgi:hypothetical protein
MGGDTQNAGPRYFESFVQQEVARWAAAIKAANISID